MFVIGFHIKSCPAADAIFVFLQIQCMKENFLMDH